MVMAGRINKEIVSTLQRYHIPGVGLSGLDGFLIRAKRKKRLVVTDDRGRKRVIDGGYTGKISEINTTLLQLLMKNGYVPIIAPIATSEENEPLNVDGDRAAAYIAGALKAERLILLTDVSGVRLEEETVPKLTLTEVEKILPKIGRGMITKIYAAREALSQGVKEVVISSGREKQPIQSALENRNGTVITHG
jgi:acetylglutamate/LysW-gamma-L-alpha-aminoadipate kinase